MNITHYTGIVEMTYQAKNKLEKEVLSMFEKIDRVLIEKNDVEDFKKIILSQIETINSNNTRCKPMKVYFESSEWQKQNKHDFVIRDAKVVSFSIRACTKYYLTALKLN
jgi:hypothetical protein